jgi:hypothetical protein
VSDRKESPRDVHAERHEQRRRYGFTHRVSDRGTQFAAWVGIDERVLDLGCREGSLTQHYAAGNPLTVQWYLDAQPSVRIGASVRFSWPIPILDTTQSLNLSRVVTWNL